MEEQTNKQDKMEKLARDVLILARNTLLVNLRFLDAALSRLELMPVEESTLLTDGKHLLFQPRHVLSCYRQERNVTVRDYLHMVLHCVFCHMFMDPNLNRPYWDLACDIAVEYVIQDLGLRCTACGRDRQQEIYMQALTKELKQVTAERIYRYLVDSHTSEERAAEIRGLFYADNHEIWYMTPEEAAARFGIPNEGDGAEDEENKTETAKDWKQVSENMQIGLQTFFKQRGTVAGNLLQNLKELNRERYDYTAFLRKFATLGEVMKINDDEFDYVYYTYGLKLYDNMPLIEPLEYKEVKRIREFVIAIDTSGSTSGDLVQTFVQKTYNILKSTESFFSKINLHIIQCDAQIQEHVHITCQEEFDQYLKEMKIHGLGGTDFRPVFEKVDQLIREKAFRNLKGLIYFTDGYGEFPAKKPAYDTAFVFVDDDPKDVTVPPWAIKLVLRSDEIQEKNDHGRI